MIVIILIIIQVWIDKYFLDLFYCVVCKKKYIKMY